MEQEVNEMRNALKKAYELIYDITAVPKLKELKKNSYGNI